MKSAGGSRGGFTLIEMLVTIAIVAVLAALLVPAIERVRAAAARAHCANNLKEIGLGLHGYHDVYGKFPQGSSRAGSDFAIQTGWGWGAAILPFLEQSKLFKMLDLAKGSAAGSNARLLSYPLAGFRCPSDIAPETVVPSDSFADLRLATGNYCGSAGLAWNRGVLYIFSEVRLGDITDGLSSTFLVGERMNQPDTGQGAYTSGWYGQLATETQYLPNSVPHLEVVGMIPINMSPIFPGCFGSFHSGGAQFVMCDGSAHFISQDINPAAFEALGSRSGGEVVDQF
jgi:prepilin-type N-terminal cleavage/methylation domain-containing protein/prepilin-type processing-associated H-X9-DG protein